MELPKELFEIILEKCIVNRWRGTPLYEIPFKDYKLIQKFTLYNHFDINYKFIERAVVNGDLHLINWLQKTEHPAFTFELIQYSASCGRLPLTEWLWEKLGGLIEHADIALAYGSKYGHIPIVEWAFPKAQDYSAAIELATKNNHINILEWFCQNCPKEKWLNSDIFTIAASHGNLYGVKWLHRQFPDFCTHSAFDWAAGNGHFKIVEWLHENCNHQPFCTLVSILVATKKGNLEMVKWLWENRPEVENALDIVQAVADTFNQREISAWTQTV